MLLQVIQGQDVLSGGLTNRPAATSANATSDAAGRRLLAPPGNPSGTPPSTICYGDCLDAVGPIGQGPLFQNAPPL